MEGFAVIVFIVRLKQNSCPYCSESKDDLESRIPLMRWTFSFFFKFPP